MNGKVGLQNIVQDLLFCGEAGYNLVHLGYDSAEEGGRAKEEKNTEDLQTES
jgi:hypothetical protein